MKIKHKLGLTTLGMSVVIIGMFLITWWVVGRQKDDGLVINLAGRQRMLSQKMTKEILLFQMEKERTGQANAKLAVGVRNTMEVFDKTLSALKDSGDAPLSLDLKNTVYRKCPRAMEPAYSQLEKVNKIWKKYSGDIEGVLKSEETSEKDMAWIVKNNLLLLKTMNTAVGMMQKQSEAKVSMLLKAQLVGILAGICFMIVAIITIFSIIKRMDRVKDFTIQLGTGHFTVKSGIESKDELGVIGKVLDEMTKNLKEIILGITGNTENMNESSTNLFSISGHVSTGAKDVSDRADTVAAAAEEMSSNMNSVAAAVEETSTNVSMVAASSEEMTSVINEIARNTEKARDITGEAVAEAKSASEKVDELGRAANEIGKVTETITEISEQINLLALNATIEAACAGEAGKGFAVVANKIKDLAKQTADATGEIRSKIEGIQNSTDGTVAQIEQITTVIKDVNEIVAIIATAVEEQSVTTKEIANNIIQASQGIAEVTENVAQSSTVSSEIARDITDVNQASSEMSESSSQVNISAENLSELADQLKKMVVKFKV